MRLTFLGRPAFDTTAGCRGSINHLAVKEDPRTFLYQQAPDDARFVVWTLCPHAPDILIVRGLLASMPVRIFGASQTPDHVSGILKPHLRVEAFAPWTRIPRQHTACGLMVAARCSCIVKDDIRG